jgi:hypothetical protein
MTYCSEGSATYYSAVAACVCTSGRCKSQCSDTGDFCNAAPDVTTDACNTCLGNYWGQGLDCDPTTGTIASTCAADPQCTAYLSCIGGCK